MVDAVSSLITIINAQWSSGVTKPSIIAPMYDHKLIDLNNDEAILVYNSGTEDRPWGIGAGQFQVKPRLSCDVQTASSRSRCVAIVDELVESLRRQLRDGGDWIVVISRRDLSSDYRKIWRFVIDVDWTYWETLA